VHLTLLNLLGQPVGWQRWFKEWPISPCIRAKIRASGSRGNWLGRGQLGVLLLTLMQTALQITSELFDVTPDWVEVSYSNEGLKPWHGGCAIGDKIQLRKEFETRERFWLCRRDELLAHELLHACRADFSDSLFEEILAFQTSRSWWRRFFSPIFGSNRETLLFLGTLLPAAALVWVSPWIYLVPGALALLGLGRLLIRQRQYRRCVRNLGRLVSHPRAVTFRLTAEEIIRFSRGEIESYVAQQTSTRWQEIKQRYF
jgi:hypothetical protein